MYTCRIKLRCSFLSAASSVLHDFESSFGDLTIVCQNVPWVVIYFSHTQLQ